MDLDRIIDINADVGEGIKNEALLFPYLSSCNIACGGHTGDLQSMRSTVKLAIDHNVKIGAHPSYPDPEHFGRRVVDMSCAAIFRSIKSQIRSLMSVLREEHVQLHHVKPHGALYNKASVDCDTADILIEVMKGIQMPLKLYVPYGSVIAERARAAEIPITYEVFMDRNYNDDLTLVSRDNESALINEPEKVCAHVLHMIDNSAVKTLSGKVVPLKAETFCIHGDNINALSILKAVKKQLDARSIKIL